MADLAGAQDRVRQQLSRVPRDPKRPSPGSASDQELTELAARLGMDIPEDLVAWLRVCNGDTTGLLRVVYV